MRIPELSGGVEGINYDSYKLVRAGKTVLFEWNNWFEWKWMVAALRYCGGIE